mmetsp:Transcript_41527/g.101377  ORF Transcript_41527/g.101377 Transcript_41527/m.101377 type:complete len:231 (+) Transcript_41527:198-890(+)
MPGVSNTKTLVSSFSILYPRIFTISSPSCSAGVASLTLHPSFWTLRHLTVTDAPLTALISRAPSSLRMPSIATSPSRRSALLPVTTTSASDPILLLMSEREVPKEGSSITSGEKLSGTPPNDPTVPSSGIDTPDMLKILAFMYIASLSAVPAHSGGSPEEAFAAASESKFLTGEKHSHLSTWVNPTLASGGSNRGKSCIMHSSRAGFLKAVFVSSEYLGLTNSDTLPPVS